MAGLECGWRCSFALTTLTADANPTHADHTQRGFWGLTLAAIGGATAALTGIPALMAVGAALVAALTVVAGVVGSRRFFYDVWGDAVNVASRMESTDPTGHIQVPQNLYERLRDEFAFVERGDIDIKGKGVMHTWYLVGRQPIPGSAGDTTAVTGSRR